MENELQAKIFTFCKTLTGYSDSNIFYMKAEKISRPYLIFLQVANRAERDTEQEFRKSLIQFSIFGEASNLTAMKTTHKYIQENFNKSKIKGMASFTADYCKFLNSGETETEDVYHIWSVFQIWITKK